MADERLFSFKPEIKLSAAESDVLQAAYERIKGKKIEVGFIIKEIAQEAVDTAIRRYTMFGDRR